MTSASKTACLLICVFFISGCEIGRSWFTMSSDSPSPFMGIDLLPRRKTTQLTPPKPGDRYPSFATNEVHQVANREPNSLVNRVKEIRLPSMLNREKDELVAFPEAIGVEGLPTKGN